VADPVDLKNQAKPLPGNAALARWHITQIGFPQEGAQRLAGDVSTGNFHPIVPLRFRKTIFDHFHIVAHPGRLASRRIISSGFVWCGLSGDVTA
jgi:hypothetical protein